MTTPAGFHEGQTITVTWPSGATATAPVADDGFGLYLDHPWSTPYLTVLKHQGLTVEAVA